MPLPDNGALLSSNIRYGGEVNEYIQTCKAAHNTYFLLKWSFQKAVKVEKNNNKYGNEK